MASQANERVSWGLVVLVWVWLVTPSFNKGSSVAGVSHPVFLGPVDLPGHAESDDDRSSEVSE